MSKKSIYNGTDSIESMEEVIAQELLENATKRNEMSLMAKEMKDQITDAFFHKLSVLEGRRIDHENIDTVQEPNFWTAIDEVYGAPGALIQPSHQHRPYSLIKKRSDTDNVGMIPDLHSEDPVTKAFNGIEIRSREILREFSAYNTERAFNGDLVYWHAWLSAIGFDFESPITLTHVKMFAIQHAEALPEDIDQRLVSQQYKQSLGTHQIATIKRRLASLSVFLELEKLPNPTKSDEFHKIMEKLTKKYGQTRKRGRAITGDILHEILKTCGSDMIDIRDKALILFGWASGGRRRSEIADADVKNIQPVGANYVYHLPKSKTDQEGKGKYLPINGLAAASLNDWLQKSAITEGKIFRSVSKSGNVGANGLTTVDINRIIKRRCSLAGFDSTLYSAHSLRSGFITESGRRGYPILEAMELSCHKSVTTAMRYYQAGSVTNNKAANMV